MNKTTKTRSNRKTNRKADSNTESRPYVSQSRQNLLDVLPKYDDKPKESPQEVYERVRRRISQFTPELQKRVAIRLQHFFTMSKGLSNVYTTNSDNLRSYISGIWGLTSVVTELNKEIQEYGNLSKKVKNSIQRAVEAERAFRHALNDVSNACAACGALSERNDNTIGAVASDGNEAVEAMSCNYSNLVDVIGIAMNRDFDGHPLDDGMCLVRMPLSQWKSIAIANPILRDLHVYGE